MNRICAIIIFYSLVFFFYLRIVIVCVLDIFSYCVISSEQGHSIRSPGGDIDGNYVIFGSFFAVFKNPFYRVLLGFRTLYRNNCIYVFLRDHLPHHCCYCRPLFTLWTNNWTRLVNDHLNSRSHLRKSHLCQKSYPHLSRI